MAACFLLSLLIRIYQQKLHRGTPPFAVWALWCPKMSGSGELLKEDLIRCDTDHDQFCVHK
eukprot:1147820-Pelagomonas_calceolata.AAC.1